MTAHPDPTAPVRPDWRTLNAGELANRLDAKLRRRAMAEAFARGRHDPVTARAIGLLLDPATADPPAPGEVDTFRAWLEEALA